MNRQKSFENDKPTLFLVATPIGNLSELTPRAIKVLSEVDLIAAEDTRQTKKLTTHFGIGTRIVTHHQHNEIDSSEGIIKFLSEGKSVALVSDAGYPLISDPGQHLVRRVTESGFNVVPISGSSASLNALVASGLDTSSFVFVGFVEKKNSIRKKQFDRIKKYPETLVFYEAPHRIVETLKFLLDSLGDRQMCLAREITKLHEEFIRGSISEVLAIASLLKGEMVIVVEGYTQKDEIVAIEDIKLLVEEKMKSGLSKSAAIKEVSEQLNISKNQIYNEFHN